MKFNKVFFLPIMLLLGMLFITDVKADGFKVSRSITGVTNTAVNTFTYSVTADSSNPATVTPPSNTTLAFTSSNAVSSNTVTSTKELIAESVWTSLTYPQPGTYKFIVSESASSNATVYPRDTSTYTVTIYVTNVTNASNVPTGEMVATYIGSQKGGTGTKITKTQNATFTSAANMSSMTVNCAVKGSLANTNEYFKYTVSLTNNVSGTTYNVSGQTSGTITYNGSSVTTSTTCTSNSCVIYLKHGQTATIGVSGSLKQLPVGITYSVAQNNTTAQSSNYTTTYKVGSASAASGTSTGNKTMNATASNNAIVFENTADDEIVPSGIFFRLFPFLLLLVLSVVGVIAIKKTKRLDY